ncbi:MAG: protein-export chaperone SecB [Deltaproteobacteria bacterium]|jgi:preprotein translocase subunit SecB|nr:protein-export chaperone SecB [Deltaproteobacteria bacterium]
MTGINYNMVRIRLQKSIFTHNPDYQPPQDEEVISLGLSLRNVGEFIQENNLANFLQCFKTQPGPNVPFSLEVEFAAIFALSAPVPKENQEIFLKKLFPQMLFPNTREYVAETTRRGGYPPLLLNMGLFKEGQGIDSSTAVESLSGTKWTH